MATLNLSLLNKICTIPGAPGYEIRIRNFIKSELEGLVDIVEVDNIGNLIAIKKGKSDKKVMLAAHMDEISFIVTHIDDQGFIKFVPLGGFDPKTLTAQRVWIHGKEDVIGVMGAKPIHIMSAEERRKNIAISDFFIDTGLPVERVKELISVGDTITRERAFIEMGDCVNCKSIDNRVCVFIQLEALRELKGVKLPYDVYAVFTVQEEVGVRGATAASLRIEPDFAINLDTTIAFDVPGAKAEEKVTSLGKGTAIKIMDARTICDYRMVDFMKAQAEKEKITWQNEILTAGGTDTTSMQQYGRAIAGGISVPTRNIHQVIEMSHKDDIRGSIDLLKSCLKAIGDFDWNHR